LNCIKSSHINYNQLLLQKRHGTATWWGCLSFLLKLRLADAFFSSFTDKFSFFFPLSRVSLLISIFLYQKHLFPLIKRTKIKRSSYLKSKKRSFGDKSGRFFNYIITRGWPGVKRVVKEDLQAHVCCK